MRITMKSILLALLGAVFWGCQSDDTASSADATAMTPDQVGFDAVLSVTNHGRLQYRIQYKKMERYSSKLEIRFLDGVEMEFYEEGEPSCTIHTQQAILNERTNNIEFRGDVQARSAGGISLSSEVLFWNDAEQRLTSDAYVTVVTTGQDTINGTGFESGKSFQEWLVREPHGTAQRKLKSPEQSEL